MLINTYMRIIHTLALIIFLVITIWFNICGNLATTFESSHNFLKMYNNAKFLEICLFKFFYIGFLVGVLWYKKTLNALIISLLLTFYFVFKIFLVLKLNIFFFLIMFLSGFGCGEIFVFYKIDQEIKSKFLK